MKLGIYLVMFFLLATFVNASYISITTDVKSELTDDKLNIYVNVSNQGDESAHNVQVWVEANEETKSSKIFDLVGIEQKVDAQFEFDVAGKNKGRYPIMVRVDYADANLYPFSALTHSFYYIEENVNPDVFASLNKLELSKRGKLTLALRNLGDDEKSVWVKLTLPKELSSFETEKTVTISPKSEKKLNFEIERFSALAGSTYVVYVVVEYDENGVHYTTFAQNFVNIVEKKGLLTPYIIIPLVIALVIVFVVLQFKKKK